MPRNNANVTLSRAALDQLARTNYEILKDEYLNLALEEGPRRLWKAPHADDSSPAGHGRTFSREPEDEGFALDQIGGGDPAEPTRGVVSGKRSAAYGTRSETTAVGHPAEFDQQIPSVSGAEALSDMLDGINQSLKALVRNQKMMSAAVARILKAADAEAAGDFNDEEDDADPDDGGDEEGEDERTKDNQDRWADGESDESDEVEKARRHRSELQEVLRGQRVLAGNVNQIISALARKDFSGLESLSTGLRPPPRIAPYGETPTELFKSRDWYEQKSKLLQEAEDEGKLTLEQVLSGADVLAKAQAVAAGVLHREILTERVKSADPDIRAMFSELLPEF